MSDLVSEISVSNWMKSMKTFSYLLVHFIYLTAVILCTFQFETKIEILHACFDFMALFSLWNNIQQHRQAHYPQAPNNQSHGYHSGVNNNNVSSGVTHHLNTLGQNTNLYNNTRVMQHIIIIIWVHKHLDQYESFKK